MTLEQWLDQATFNIEDQAAQRIQNEVRAHLADALSAGTTENAFVADLGSAKIANVGFMRAHLTLSEVALLDSPRGPLHPRWLWLYGIYCVCAFITGFFNSPLRGGLVLLLVLAGLVFWFWLQGARRSGRLSTRQAGQLCWDGCTVITGLGVALASGQVGWLICCVTVMTGAGISLRRKLKLDARRAAD
jgi:hypothetical protein